MRKLTFLFLFFGLLVASSLAIFRATTLVSWQATIPPVALAKLDSVAAISQLSKAIQCETTAGHRRGFGDFWTLIANSFLKLHQQPSLSIGEYNEHTAIYKWAGRQPALPAIVLVAEFDVPEPSLSHLINWKFNPFLGKVQDGYIYGAGTMRGKTNLMAIFAALEELAKSGFEPQRTIFVIAMHDGYQLDKPTIQQIAAEMQGLAIPIQHVLAAGSSMQNNILGINKAAAIVSVAPQQQLGLRLSVAKGDTSWLAAIDKIGNLQPATDISATSNAYFLDYIAPELGFGQKLVFSNRYLASSYIKGQLEQSPRLLAANRMQLSMRIAENTAENGDSSLVFIRLSVGAQSDIYQLHSQAAALLQADSLNYTTTYILPTNTVAAQQSKGFELIHTSAKQTLGDIIVLPAGADAPNLAAFLGYSNTPVLEFSPLACKEGDYQRLISGIDERISASNYLQMIRFYMQYLQNADI
jgi:carboxypeptidase PM20D1